VKIALVLEHFDPARGGLENWTWQLARSLRARGHEIHVLALDFHTQASDDGIIPHRIEPVPSRLDRAEAVARLLASMRMDVVHDIGLGWAADIFQPQAGSTKALWQHNLMRIPKWRQIRFWREKRYRELAEIERRQHASTAVVVAVSRMLAKQFETLHRLPADRLRVIYNGVDVDRFSPARREDLRAETRQKLRIAEDEILFLMLAHNLLLKNAEASIRAIAQLRHAGKRVRLVIGGGHKPARFRKLARKLDIASAVTFMPLVDPVPYYAAADVFVHPTWYDPCSLVTLEASSSGLPVITTRFNGAAELMKSGREGFVLEDPADASALAGRMSELLNAPTRNAMGAAGRTMAIKNTFDNQMDNLVALYKQIASRRHPRDP